VTRARSTGGDVAQGAFDLFDALADGLDRPSSRHPREVLNRNLQSRPPKAAFDLSLRERLTRDPMPLRLVALTRTTGASYFAI
jgi:hypothetical protein